MKFGVALRSFLRACKSWWVFSACLVGVLFYLWVGATVEGLVFQLLYMLVGVALPAVMAVASRNTVIDGIHRFIVPATGDAPTDDARRSARLVAILLLSGAVLIFSLLIFNVFAQFKIHPFENGNWQGSLGAFGDFFGGVINPVLTFISFIALAFSFTLQREQVRDARINADASQEVAEKQINASARQMFETTFFNLLMLHNSSAEQLYFDSHTFSNISGRSRTEAEKGKESIRGRAVFGAVMDVIHARADTNDLTGGPIDSTPARIYREIQESHNHVLGQYFRNLFQVLSYIDETDSLKQENGEKRPAKVRYANILRAQLSTNELSLLYFNCHGKTVDDGRFRELVVRYRLLEHMSVRLGDRPRIEKYDFEIDVREYAEIISGNKLSPGAFGTNPQIGRYLKIYNADQS